MRADAGHGRYVIGLLITDENTPRMDANVHESSHKHRKVFALRLSAVPRRAGIPTFLRTAWPQYISAERKGSQRGSPWRLNYADNQECLALHGERQ